MLPSEMDFELDVDAIGVHPGSRYHLRLSLTINPTDVLDHFAPHQLAEYLESLPEGARLLRGEEKTGATSTILPGTLRYPDDVDPAKMEK